MNSLSKNIFFNALIMLNINIKRLEEGYRFQLELILCRIYGVKFRPRLNFNDRSPLPPGTADQ